MIVIKDALIPEMQPVAATVGFFDGVHRGHRFLIDELKKTAAQRNLPSAVVTFPEHPRAVLHTHYQPKLLNSFEEKITQLATTGVDYCFVLPFTPELAQMPAGTFITEVLHRRFGVQTLLTGYDHRFGHNRTDGFDEYVRYGKACGLEVLKAPALDNGLTRVSSSEIRSLLAAGHVQKANGLLTYPYQLKGTVVTGHQIGRTLGFPTANLRVNEPFKVIPGLGIYAVRVVTGGTCYDGMLYIGNRPTLNNGAAISLEVHLLEFSGNLYGRELEICFEAYLRDNMKFDSLDSLRLQLEKDRDAVKALFNR